MNATGPKVFTWATASRDEAGACGVNDDEDAARRDLEEGLRRSGSVYGVVQRAHVSFSGRGYVYDRVVARAVYDPAVDLVSWQDGDL
jgi:hypothetical protein